MTEYGTEQRGGGSVVHVVPFGVGLLGICCCVDDVFRATFLSSLVRGVLARFVSYTFRFGYHRCDRC